jgi:hypothetical protein
VRRKEICEEKEENEWRGEYGREVRVVRRGERRGV